MSDEQYNRQPDSSFAGITDIIDKINKLEQRLNTLLATQSSGQQSYNQTVVPANYSHVHRRSSILDLTVDSDIDHDALTNFVAAEHVSLPNTIANVLSDHDKAAHDALTLSHDSLSDVSTSDHHVKTVSGDIDHDATTNFTATEHFTMLDEDNMATNSATQAATQQSIKAYIGAQTHEAALTSEQVQDIVGAMFAGNTETRIAVTYEDGDGTIDLVVDDMAGDTQLTEEQVEDFVGGMLTGNTETLITVTYQDGDGTIDFVVDEASINHDALTNFVAAEHKLEADIDHDALTNFVANEHIDWTSTAENFETSGTVKTTTSIQVAGGTVITTLGDVAALAASDVKIPTNTTVKEYVDNAVVTPSKKISPSMITVHNGCAVQHISGDWWKDAGIYYPASTAGCGAIWNFSIPDEATDDFKIVARYFSANAITYDLTWHASSCKNAEERDATGYNVLNGVTNKDPSPAGGYLYEELEIYSGSAIDGGDTLVISAVGASEAQYMMMEVYVTWGN